jgi:branched-chain amino acid transport system substrate-binding protein
MVARTRSPVASALGVALRDFALGASKVLKIGFLAPLTGPLKAWSAPGLDGCRIWVDRLNAAGGVKIGSRRYLVELIPFDTMYQPERAFQGAKKLILEDGVKLILMNGGNDLTRDVRKLISQHRMLVAGLLPSDLSPDTPTLVAPSEVHPIYNVTGVEWLISSVCRPLPPTAPPSRPPASSSWQSACSIRPPPISGRSSRT